MLKPLSLRLLIKKYILKGGAYGFGVGFLLLFTGATNVDCLTKYNLETATLSRLEYVLLKTSNGSQSICYIKNTSYVMEAIVVTSGASELIYFDDGTKFNGIHELNAQKQIIVLADFRGNNVIVSNLSTIEQEVEVAFYHPSE